jgi:hypothetical protein
MFKFLKSFLIALIISLPIFTFAQSGPPAPSSGIWAIIDTTYQVGQYSIGQSKAKITLKNNTSILYTGVQFRVFYDTAAFTSASVGLLGSSTNLNLQSINDSINGSVTISLVYTGSSNTFSIQDGETFEITFNHASATAFYALTTIDSLKFTGGQTFPQLAAEQSGLDTVLNLYSYGGVWEKPTLDFHGTFTNVTSSPSKNLPLSLEKRVKPSGSWNSHATYSTDINGDFAFTEPIDTTYYDVRLAIKGDTMSVGNVISTADAQLINQWILGSSTPTAWDFYTGDINGSNSLSITDAYGVFGRIAGRFSSWPNSVEDIKFFTTSEYNTITGTPSTNYTGTISGVTNFYHDIIAGQPDSVQFYVLIPGDANGTGYNMARLTPIEVLPNPVPGYPSAIENVIDMRVEYDFPTSSMEIKLPSLVVKEGNLIELPVSIKTYGESISSLQLAMLYDESLLEFKDIKNSAKSMFWMSSINPTNGIIEWAGYDPSANKSYMITDNYEVFTLRFIAKKPQDEWGTSPLYTSRKFSGNGLSRDMTITPSNGILIVARMAPISGGLDEDVMRVFPNPTSGEITITFTVKQTGRVKLYMIGMSGQVNHVILDKDMPEGEYVYTSNINHLNEGIYVASLQAKNQNNTTKIIKK